MAQRRSMLLHGLRITLSRPRAVVWTYVFNLGLALLFSIRFNAGLNDILGHSLGAQRLTTAFDLGVVAAAIERVNRDAPSTGLAGMIGPAFYVLIYFLLVPGTLFCYQTEAPARLSILLSIGFQRFWRFVRIAVFTLIVSAVILGPLLAIQTVWSTHVDDTTVGVAAIYEKLAGWLIIAIVAAIIRLYFDLVEVYTLFLGDQLRPTGRPDRRVHRVLLPALRTLRLNFFRALGSFLSLAVVGFLALFLTARLAMHMLAQPRVWPMFLVAQLGLFIMLFTRFWQRGAETTLAFDHPLPIPKIAAPLPPPVFFPDPVDDEPDPIPYPAPQHLDAQPNPEPATPSLDEPDPGVFHHDPPTT
ncbi:hypothetical protein [Granulicella tundricola]|uniref:Glycerophosphoryl diester phosphodiesterase membrane domain-containing protein n=1 Tax=Granulicella tundricola (strain ATCC BAA-1859 / DSM 23138 / MP5ACTX9) TaxID=1198114 RepID=E8X2A4_GRATM|nr:hypothetical protein [Granulicella tundricola]ADW68036.1 hypothetical protein AciX9_0969 [Granulicella tundricola MP5ACTX9]